jgi:hypothetical protein
VDGIYVSSIAIAYDDPTTLSTFVLIFHESLQVPGMAHHMLCPNQLRDNGIVVNDIPLMFTPENERSTNTHAIVTTQLVIPLDMDGVHSSFTCRPPTDYELANPSLFTHITMTSDRLWEPHDISFSNYESSIRASLSYTRYTPYESRQISDI